MNPGYIALISLGSLLALAFLIYLFAVKTRYNPAMPAGERIRLQNEWRRAVERAKEWAE